MRLEASFIQEQELEPAGASVDKKIIELGAWNRLSISTRNSIFNQDLIVSKLDNCWFLSFQSML